jgi:hypothetical protein
VFSLKRPNGAQFDKKEKQQVEIVVIKRKWEKKVVARWM